MDLELPHAHCLFCSCIQISSGTFSLMSLPFKLTQRVKFFSPQKAAGHVFTARRALCLVVCCCGEKPEQQAAVKAASGFLQREGVKFSHQPLGSAAAV